MFNLFKNNKLPKELIFKSTEGAFEYASRFMRYDGEITEGSNLIGIVEEIIPGQEWDSLKCKVITNHEVITLDRVANAVNICYEKEGFKAVTIMPKDLVVVQPLMLCPGESLEYFVNAYRATMKVKPILDLLKGFKIDADNL